MENLEKLLVLAPEELNEEQQLAVFIGIMTDEPPIPLAKKLLESFGSIKGLLAADYGMLRNVEGINHKLAVALKACMGLALSSLKDPQPKESAFTREAAINVFKRKFAFCKKETMFLMLIDKSGRILDVVKVAEGSHDRLNVDNKDIINAIVKYNAVKAVLAHNHFTGLSPSVQDVVSTSKLVWLLGHLNVELCDHFIFFENKHHSMLEAGEMTPITYNIILNEDY